MAEEREREKGTMTMSEAGHKGGEHSWTANPQGAKVPQLSEEDKRREQEIRAKLQRGEELTTEEAGFLGGVERVRQAQKASEKGRQGGGQSR